MKKSARQLDRDIAEALGRGTYAHATVAASAGGKQPLYGHTSEATAYLVDDYPYGFRERTQIRYWLEHKPKKGWRFVSQTLNPKTKRWNKPKASTYADFGAAMYLDENGHVQWEGIGPYSDDQKVLSFVRDFPEAPSELRKLVPIKLRFLRDRLSGKVFMTVNDVRQPLTEADVERLQQELAIWEEIQALLG